ncbi:MAG: tol-pal system protein YbgF [Acidobacteria bacterium]|nr:tol-pal system protein YbgF [Acidobacteriota bacterium]
MRRALLLVLCFVWLTPAGFAQKKEVIQLQQDMALLHGMVREMQRSFDEKMAVVQTLLGQSSERSNHIIQSTGQLNAAISNLEKAVQTSNANAGQKIDTMRTEVQGIQASLDELRARLDKLSQEIAKLASAQQSIPSATAPPPGGAMNFPGGMGEPGAGVPTPSPDVLYNTALRDYTAGNYPLALQEFTDFLRYYPNTTLASNAQFYIGDIYYQQGQFERAIEEYDKAIEQYPNGNKSAAAQLKKGYALINMNMRTQGTRELNNLIKRFPNTPEAALAKDKLTTLSSERTAPPRRRPTTR